MSATGDATTAAAPAAEAGAAPGTLPGLLLHRATATPDVVALRQKRHGLWRETTWGAYARRVAAVAAGLARLGVAAGDRVAIHAENRIEWPLVDLAVQALGAMTVGIYPTSPASEVEYLLAHSRASVLVAEDEEQLDKALGVRQRLPELGAIVVIDPRGVDLELPGVLPWTALEDPDADPAVDGAALESAAVSLEPSAPAIVVYTSGTTGPPKGALLSHANLDAAGRTFAELYPATARDELLSYLPLCHVAERLLSVVGNLHSGYVVSFGEGGEAFVEDLREVQPTFFLGVPRVWEKLHAGIETRIADSSRLKRTLYARLTAVRDRAAARRRTGRGAPADPIRELVAEALVHRALRDRLGLRRVRHALSGAAPISPRILEALWAIGIPVREAYGQTENTAIATSTPPGDVRIGTVGVACPRSAVRIAEDGEILTRSDGVFLGYLDDPEATRAAVDAQGWLHTGDVGELDADGHLRITDRKKDIIITAGGKNVSPSEVENRLKVSPFVREAIVVGDRRRFLVALIGIEQDTVGDWAGRHGVSYTTYADLSRRPEVRELLQGVVDEANGDLAQVEQVKRFALLDKELDHEDGELTATQKVRRAAIERRFADLIEELYAGSAA